MSYTRDRSTSETDHRAGGGFQPAGPGKANLTDGLIQRKANGSESGPGKRTLTGAPVEMAAPATRDLVPLEDGAHSGEASAPRDPRITTPAPGGGANVAATVVAATAETEPARDGGLTPALIAALHANPDLSIDEVLQHIAAFPIGGPHAGLVQHPTIVQYGRMAQAAPGSEPGKKQAVLVANQDYANMRDLFTPISEATQMRGELSSRGYEVDVHTDKTSTDMSAIWGAMVGAAKPGDDLVAHYGGHGLPAGLVGVEHDFPPEPADLFTNAQVSGVVGMATGKGAHIRFVMDSCYSGAAVQTVREVRENELAAAARSPDDKLRVEGLASVRQMKQRLLELRQRRSTGASQIRAALAQHTASAPDPANAEETKTWTKISGSLRNIEAVWVERHDREEDKLWAELLPQIEAVRAVVKYAVEPPRISDYSLGAQLNYLDDLSNALAQPVEESIAHASGSASGGDAAGPGAQPQVPR